MKKLDASAKLTKEVKLDDEDEEEESESPDDSEGEAGHDPEIAKAHFEELQAVWNKANRSYCSSMVVPAVPKGRVELDGSFLATVFMMPIKLYITFSLISFQ